MSKLIIFILFTLSLEAFSGVQKNQEPSCSMESLEIPLGMKKDDLIELSDKIKGLLLQEPFYEKVSSAGGVIVKGSKNIDDQSLSKASLVVQAMLSKRPDIKQNIIDKNVSIVVIAKNENYCDLPETQDLKNQSTFDGRSFCTICGAGANEIRPITAVCEDNLLKTKNDPYFGTEDILTHELAHTIHLMGMNSREKERLMSLYEEVKKKGKYELNKEGTPTYMMANEEEFFACLSAMWFNVHNPKSYAFSPALNNRETLKAKLPAVYEFLREFYPDFDLAK